MTLAPYVLASNVPEIVPFLAYIAFPVPLGLTVIQILSIDLGTDLLPAIGLGCEPPEQEVISTPPRRTDEKLLSTSVMVTSYLFLGLIQAAWSLFLFFGVLGDGGWKWGKVLGADSPLYRSATGITLSTIVLMQAGNVISRRKQMASGLDSGLFSNPLLLMGILAELVFSWAVLYCPPVQRLLGTGPVSGRFYLLAWLGIPILFLCELLRKYVIQSWLQGRQL